MSECNFQFTAVMPERDLIGWAEHFRRKGIPFEIKEGTSLGGSKKVGPAIFINYRNLTMEELTAEGWHIKAGGGE